MISGQKLLRATLVVENRVRSHRFIPSWGLSIFIEMDNKNLLFDVGPSYDVLAANAKELGVDLENIDAVFISHWHGDHYGALHTLLKYIKERKGKEIPVYTPSPGGLPNEVPCKPKQYVLNIGFSTGPLGFGIREHSLVIPVASNRIAVFVGCSHPGIDEILSRAIELSNASEIELVMGGLHIGPHEADYVASAMKAYNVKRLVPAHCTSDDAIEILKEELRGICEVIEPSVGLTIRVV